MAGLPSLCLVGSGPMGPYTKEPQSFGLSFSKLLPRGLNTAQSTRTSMKAEVLSGVLCLLSNKGSVEVSK